MFKQIQNMKPEINELIEKNKVFYTLSFITLIFSFFFFYMSVATIFNLYEYDKSLNSSYKMNIYINKNVSQNSIETIEKEFLQLDGIETISYTDKNIALNKLTETLGITDNGLDNPLLNSFEITTNGEEALRKAQTTVEEIDGVKEVVISEDNISSLNEKISQNKKIIFWLFIITLIPIKIIIFIVMHSTIISQNHDIEAKLYLGLEKKEVLKPYYFINNIKFISAAIIGSLIFLNLYVLLLKSFNNSIFLVPFHEISVLSGVLLIIISLLFPFISSKIIRVKG